MPFEKDIFISYAHIDNESPLEGHEGWVSQFHRALEVRVAQLLGKKPSVWRDPKLQGNDIFAETLVDTMPKVALLVSVLTPRYVQSEWCIRELKEFSKASEQTGGVRHADKARLFKVVKTPVPPERHPSEIQPLLGYEFFRTDPETGRVRELDQVFGPDAQREFWARLDDLAHDIADLLQRLGDEATAAASAASPAPSGSLPAAATSGSKGTVYLAPTTADMRDAYDVLKRDLQRHGYAVRPEGMLPLIAEECEAYVRDELAGCSMSIHVIGGTYGLVPEGATESIVALQHELAVERGADDGFKRLIWIPRNLEPADERQAELIRQIRNDPRMAGNVDLLEVSLEDLKTVVHHELSPPAAASRGGAGASGDEAADDLTRIYLICDQRDQDASSDVQAFLFDRGYEVILPAFEGDESEVREDHEENLRVCDAALVYYGAGNELWLRRKLRELQKAAGLGRTQRLTAKGILVAPPTNPAKERLRTREAVVMHRAGELADDLAAFLAALRPGRSESAG